MSLLLVIFLGIIFLIPLTFEIGKRNKNVKVFLEKFISFSDEKRWYAKIIKYSLHIIIFLLLSMVGYFFKTILETVVLIAVAFFGGKYLWGKYKDSLKEFANEFFKKINAKRDEEFIITAISNVGGKINPSGENLVKFGEDISFSFEPDPGYEISKVLADEANVVRESDSGLTLGSVDSNHTIRVEFKLIS